MQLPTSEEILVTTEILKRVDKDQLGVLTAQQAKGLLSLVQLPIEILREIWSIVDTDSAGFLTEPQIQQFVRLLGYAQTEEPIRRTLLRSAGPVCRIQGWTVKKGQVFEEPCDEEEQQLVTLIMDEADPDHYGVLDGATARDILKRSGLPTPILGKIWDIVDNPPKGFLVANDLKRCLRLVSCAQKGERIHSRLYEKRTCIYL